MKGNCWWRTFYIVFGLHANVSVLFLNLHQSVILMLVLWWMYGMCRISGSVILRKSFGMFLLRLLYFHFCVLLFVNFFPACFNSFSRVRYIRCLLLFTMSVISIGYSLTSSLIAILAAQSASSFPFITLLRWCICLIFCLSNVQFTSYFRACVVFWVNLVCFLYFALWVSACEVFWIWFLCSCIVL